MEFRTHKIKKKNKYKYNKNKLKEFEILLSNLVHFTSDRGSSKTSLRSSLNQPER